MQRLFVFWCKFALNCGVTAPDFPTNWSDLFLDVFSAYVKSMALLILTREVYETRARARQERIESELTRDLFALRLSSCKHAQAHGHQKKQKVKLKYSKIFA